MGVVVLKDLDHCHPRARLVVDLGLSTKSEHLLFLIHTVHHMSDGHGIHASIGIDGHEEANHVCLKIEIHHGTLDGRIKFRQLTSVVNAVEVSNGDELRVTLTTISRLGRGGSFRR